MNCGDAKERLSALLDGELDDAEAAGVRAHLEECGRCRAHHAELLAITAALRGAPRPPAPEGFAAGVMTVLAGRRRGKHLVLVSLAGLAAAATLLLAVLPLPWSSTPGPDSPATLTAREPAPLADRVPPPRSGTPAPTAEEESAPPRRADTGFVVERTLDGAPAPAPSADSAKSVPRDSRPGLTAGAEGPGQAWAPPGAALQFVVAGGEPDSAAGRILAELDHRRRRASVPASGEAGARECTERVVADVRGELRALYLCLTPDEVRYVLSLLGEQGDLEVTRRDGASGGVPGAGGSGADREEVEILFEER